MQIIKCSLRDVAIIEPQVFADARGAFWESFNPKMAAQLGITSGFAQDNHSSSHKNVLRGLHYQTEHTQGKLVRVVAGSAFDVAVDLRKSSPTFGKWEGFVLSAANKRVLWVPPGFAHGYLATSDHTELLYKATDVYHPSSERTLAWNDEELGIQWPLSGASPILSEKDARGVRLRDAETFA